MSKRGTCDGCGKVRKVGYLTLPGLTYYRLCSECAPKVTSKDDLIKIRQDRPKKERRPRFAYPCVAGPLDGLYATTDDMVPRRLATATFGKWEKGDIIQEGGMYGHLADEYAQYNSAGGGRKRVGGSPSMIFVHKSVLLPLTSPKNR